MLTSMASFINTQVIDLTLDDSEDEPSQRSPSPTEEKKKKRKRLPSKEGPSNAEPIRPSIEAPAKSNGSPSIPGGSSEVVGRIANPHHQAEKQLVPESLPPTRTENDVSGAPVPMELRAEEPAREEATPRTPETKVVSPSNQKVRMTPASFFEPFAWLERSSMPSSQKTKTSKKLKMPKRRETSKTNGMKPLLKDTLYESPDAPQDDPFGTQWADVNSNMDTATATKTLKGTLNLTVRSEKATTGTDQVKKPFKTSVRSSQAPTSNSNLHLEEDDVIHVASDIKKTKNLQPLSTERQLITSQANGFVHAQPALKDSAAPIIPATFRVVNIKQKDTQVPVHTSTHSAYSYPVIQTDRIKAPAASTSIAKPQSAARASAAEATKLKSKDLHVEVIRYLDRVGIEWYARERNSETVFVLTKHLAAIRDGLLGNISGENFSLDVNSQGELLVTRKDAAHLKPTNPQDFTLEKSSNVASPSSQIQREIEGLASMPLVDKMANYPKPSSPGFAASEPTTSNVKLIQNYEKQTKRKLESMESNHKIRSIYENTWSGSENHDSDYLTTDSTGRTFRRNSKRKAVKSSSPQHQTHNESYPTTVAARTKVGHQGIPKTRVFGYPMYSRGSLLRNRDINGPGGLNTQQSFAKLRDSYLDTAIRPWRTWTGASKDIINIAWAPNGLSFVAGSSTDLDERNLQYNRSNNLLWCNITQGTMFELDDHKIERPKLNTAESMEEAGPSSVLDTHIFTTISDICYCRDPTQFWTASYDKTVKLWDTTKASPKCVGTIICRKQVDILASCEASSHEILAVGQKSPKEGVQIYEVDRTSPGQIPEVYHIESDNENPGIESDQAVRYDLVPTALSWGSIAAGTGKLLATGYGERGLETVRRCRGDIVLWDAEAESTLVELVPRFSYVYDLKWHPQERWLAAAVPVKETPHAGLRGTQSNIRIWEPHARDRYIFDLDCLALDINQVIFNPLDSMLISAACTDGTVYHYDLRQPLQILAKLEHDDSIMTLDPDRSRESQDPGVQFLSWNAAGTLLYSGSSDGKVKQWNPALNAKDAFIKDIATLDAGVSSGAFSPDFTNLLIGTNKGSAHVFSSAPVTPWVDADDEDNEATSFNYRPARGYTGR